MFHGFQENQENQENTFIHPKKAPYVIPFPGRWGVAICGMTTT